MNSRPDFLCVVESIHPSTSDISHALRGPTTKPFGEDRFALRFARQKRTALSVQQSANLAFQPGQVVLIGVPDDPRLTSK
jgi:hypothetical protein